MRSSPSGRRLDVRALPRRTRINGRYEVRERIGAGWEGVSYRVRDRLDGRDKGLKFITNVKRRKAILNQARVLVRLHHPNIINYYTVDRGDVGGESTYFLLTEYLEGPRLSQVIQRHFRRDAGPPVFYGLRIFTQICRGMAYVHDQRIVHDDLHVDNIILTGDPAYPVPKLFDFWGSFTARPEGGKAFDLRCAGLVLFEIMTGEEDYRVGALDGLPPEVAAIIRRSFARNRPFRSFYEVLEELDRLRDWD
jgi:serine/threonine protein kinase